MTKRVLTGLLAAVLVLSLTGCHVPEKPSESSSEESESFPPTETFTETETEPEPDLRTNDVIVLFTANAAGSPGLADRLNAVSKIREECESEARFVEVADLGDFYSEGLSREAVLLAMNAVPYNFVVPGDGDLSIGGTEGLADIANQSTAKFLAANLQYGGMYLEISESFISFDIETYEDEEGNTRKIAYIGVMMPEPECLSACTEDGEPVLSFLADEGADFFYKIVQMYIDECLLRGAEKVVVLSHLSNAPEKSPYSADEFVSRTTGVAALLDGGSKAVESRTVLNAKGEPVAVSGGGEGLSVIGKLVISEDGTVSITAEPVD